MYYLLGVIILISFVIYRGVRRNNKARREYIEEQGKMIAGSAEELVNNWLENLTRGELTKFDGSYNSEGEKDGVESWLHTNGQLKCKVSYKNGKIVDDKVVYYNDAGEVYKTVYYEDGEEIRCEGECDQ